MHITIIIMIIKIKVGSSALYHPILTLLHLGIHEDDRATVGRTSVSESSVSIGDSLQEMPPTEYVTEEGHHNSTNGVTDLNSEVAGKSEQNEEKEPSNVQNKIDLSKDEESPDLNNEITETPINETTFTGNYYYCTV